MNITDLIFSAIAGAGLTVALGCFLSFPGQSRKKKIGPKRVRKMEEMLPPFLDSLASNLQVGNSLQQSLEMTAGNTRNQLGAFFEVILLKVRSGVTLDTSLERHAGDLNGCSLSLALLSMASSYRSGSNLVESLSLLANLCRERENLKKKILVRTAQSRVQGYVIMFVPVLFMLLLYIVSPQNMLPVLGSVTGKMILSAAAVLQGIGIVVIRAMIKQEILG